MRRRLPRTTAGLCNTWNAATDPRVFRTDHDHARQRQRARAADALLRSTPHAGRWREFTHGGARWPVGHYSGVAGPEPKLTRAERRQVVEDNRAHASRYWRVCREGATVGSVEQSTDARGRLRLYRTYAAAQRAAERLQRAA